MRSLGALLLLLAACALVAGDAQSASPPRTGEATACEGARPPLPQSLFYELRAGAFPGSGRPDVAVHVPPGFDATRRPGVVVYFHGWDGCVQAALGDDDVPCSDGGDARAASHLAAQLDAARVNALLVAVELRADLSTGEPGQLATLGGLRSLLRELFDEHLGPALGERCSLEVDALDRVVVVAHSGGYQAAATVLAMGDVPAVREVVLLDALYGADDVFERWVGDALVDASRRFVDLYTCCGGTLERSRGLAARFASPWTLDDDGESDLSAVALEEPLVFKRVPRAHGELPAAYLRPVLETAGFAPLAH
ncbi:MAG TPA: hypothetical protein VGL81_30285 [Polyangiaceae bacterium]|jgi:hypothetical protein